MSDVGIGRRKFLKVLGSGTYAAGASCSGMIGGAAGLAALLGTYQGSQRSQGAAGGHPLPVALLKLTETVRESGLTFGDDTPIAARKPHIGYYLGAPVGSISTRGQLNHMASSGIHYLLVSDIESRMFPSLAPMLTDRQPVRNFPGYRFLAAARYREKSGRKQTATLYAVDNPAAWNPPDLGARISPSPSPAGLDRLDYLRTKLARWYMNWTVGQPMFPLFSMMDPGSRIHTLVREAEGDANLASGNYHRASSIYRDLLDGPDAPLDTLLRLALASHLAGDSGEFGKYMKEFASRAGLGENPTANDMLAEAVTRCRVRNYVPSVALLIQVRLLDPAFANPEDYRMLGYCYLNFRHPDRARAAFGEFLKLVPDDPEILDVLQDDSRLVPPLP